MSKKCLVIVDMQNDFITGSLSNQRAKEIIPAIISEIQSMEYDHVVFTQDTHHENYLSTPEGKHLPVKHCIRDTEGWNIETELFEEACMVLGEMSFFHKPTFGSIGLLNHIESIGEFDEVVMCGTCTDICVISNAIILKTLKPSLEVSVIENACAGLTEEKHNAAIEVMRSCQINIIDR